MKFRLSALFFAATIACGTPAEQPAKDGAEAPAPAPAAAPEPAPEPAKAEGADCAAVSAKIVEILSEQGDDAFLKKEDIPEMTASCEKANNLETHKETIACLMKATKLEEAKPCDLNGLIKSWP